MSVHYTCPNYPKDANGDPVMINCTLHNGPCERQGSSRRPIDVAKNLRRVSKHMRRVMSKQDARRRGHKELVDHNGKGKAARAFREPGSQQL